MKIIIINRQIEDVEKSLETSLISTRFDNFNTARTNVVITCDITEERRY